MPSALPSTDHEGPGHPVSSPVGVAVVHHGDPVPTLRCLRSIADDPSTVERSVVLVDNSPDGAGGIDAEDLLPGVRYLPCPDNPGFGSGANRGIDALDPAKECGAYLVLNHDVEILPGYLDAAVESLDSERTGAVAGPIYRNRPDGGFWYAGGEFRFLTGTVRHSEAPEDAAQAREVNFLPGAAVAVSARAWHDVGGFDPRFFLYHEDVDLSLRLQRAGWKLCFEPRMKAVHHVGSATGSGEISPFFLEHLLATRLRPHPSLLYRTYLALIHTPHELYRALTFLAQEGREALPKVRAILRGQRRALLDLFHRR